MYMVSLKSEFTPDLLREVQEHVRQCGGLILMATRNGPLALIPPANVAAVVGHPEVGFVGGVTLDPSGFAAERLQRVFLDNLSKQLQALNSARQEPTP